MKIRLGTLRKIISEEISRSLTEGAELAAEYAGWLRLVQKNPAAADAWDAMVAAAEAGSVVPAGDIAKKFNLNPGEVSMNLRRIISNLRGSKPIPSGEDFKAAASSNAAAAAARRRRLAICSKRSYRYLILRLWSFPARLPDGGWGTFEQS